MKIEERKFNDSTRHNIYFYGTKDDGTKYSIVNIGELMKTSIAYQEMKNAGMFMGWEAMLIKADGTLEYDEQERADSLEELITLLN